MAKSPPVGTKISILKIREIRKDPASKPFNPSTKFAPLIKETRQKVVIKPAAHPPAEETSNAGNWICNP